MREAEAWVSDRDGEGKVEAARLGGGEGGRFLRAGEVRQSREGGRRGLGRSSRARPGRVSLFLF